MELLRRERILNPANLLTLLRIGLLPVVVWRFSLGDMRGALAVYLISMLTDAADGAVARRFHLVTDLGKLLDPIADKLSLLVMLGMFVADGQIPGWIMYAVLLKEAILIAGSGIALHDGMVVSALPIGKATTVCFTLSMAVRLLSLRGAADILLALSLMLCFASLMWYSTSMLRLGNTDKAESTK